MSCKRTLVIVVAVYMVAGTWASFIPDSTLMSDSGKNHVQSHSVPSNSSEPGEQAENEKLWLLPSLFPFLTSKPPPPPQPPQIFFVSPSNSASASTSNLNTPPVIIVPPPRLSPAAPETVDLVTGDSEDGSREPASPPQELQNAVYEPNFNLLQSEVLPIPLNVLQQQNMTKAAAE